MSVVQQHLDLFPEVRCSSDASNDRDYARVVDVDHLDRIDARLVDDLGEPSEVVADSGMSVIDAGIHRFRRRVKLNFRIERIDGGFHAAASREYQPSLGRTLWVLDGTSPAAQVIKRHRSKNSSESGVVQLICDPQRRVGRFCRETHLHTDMLNGFILIGVFELVAHRLHSRIVCKSGANRRQNCVGRRS